MKKPDSSARRGLPALLLFGLVGCTLPGQPDPKEREKTPDEVRDFATLYGQNCAGCHGADGKNGPAPPLNDPLFLAIVPDETLRTLVAHGRKGTLMPGFGGRQPAALLQPGKAVIQQGELTQEQVDILVKGLRANWGKPGYDPAKLPPYLLPEVRHASLLEAIARGVAKAAGAIEPPRPGNEKAGAKVFAAACASCHGKDGKGGKHGAVNDPDFLALVSKQLLRRLVITGRPDLGMPTYAEMTDRPLTEAEINDVVALLESWKQAASAP